MGICNLGNVLRPDEEKVIEKSLVEPKLVRGTNDLREALDSLGAEPLDKEQLSCFA